MTIKKLFAFLFYFDKIDNFDNELQWAQKPNIQVWKVIS